MKSILLLTALLLSSPILASESICSKFPFPDVCMKTMEDPRAYHKMKSEQVKLCDELGYPKSATCRRSVLFPNYEKRKTTSIERQINRALRNGGSVVLIISN